MAPPPKKPVPPKAKTAAPKPAAKPPIAIKKPSPIAKPLASKPVEAEAPKLPLILPAPVEAPKAAVAQAAEAPKPAPQPVAAEAPKPVPVIIAEPVPPTVPMKLSVVPSAAAPVAVKRLDSAAMMKGYEDLTAFGKDSFDAVVKANTMLAKGLEDFGREVFDIARTHMEEATKLATSMLQAKTLQEVVEMHAELTKSSLEKLMAESSTLSELGMKVTNEAMAPLNAQMTKAVEKMRELAAA